LPVSAVDLPNNLFVAIFCIFAKLTALLFIVAFNVVVPEPDKSEPNVIVWFAVKKFGV
jgi:hypothetical protein